MIITSLMDYSELSMDNSKALFDFLLHLVSPTGQRKVSDPLTYTRMPVSMGNSIQPPAPLTKYSTISPGYLVPPNAYPRKASDPMTYTYRPTLGTYAHEEEESNGNPVINDPAIKTQLSNSSADESERGDDITPDNQFEQAHAHKEEPLISSRVQSLSTISNASQVTIKEKSLESSLRRHSISTPSDTPQMTKIKRQSLISTRKISSRSMTDSENGININ